MEVDTPLFPSPLPCSLFVFLFEARPLILDSDPAPRGSGCGSVPALRGGLSFSCPLGVRVSQQSRHVRTPSVLAHKQRCAAERLTALQLQRSALSALRSLRPGSAAEPIRLATPPAAMSQTSKGFAGLPGDERIPGRFGGATAMCMPSQPARWNEWSERLNRERAGNARWREKWPQYQDDAFDALPWGTALRRNRGANRFCTARDPAQSPRAVSTESAQH